MNYNNKKKDSTSRTLLITVTHAVEALGKLWTHTRHNSIIPAGVCFSTVESTVDCCVAVLNRRKNKINNCRISSEGEHTNLLEGCL